ncbi:MAG: M20/M25/M40 family metallo-hydrolase [Thermoguttaceae bacterium]|jgi:acetylornithine deacetylase/succinyl-diaminopimelate desuccinylase-like protein|nr:M20/M25/M40 family metallo-hydrolase [Thermoguttaceae bacterium]
MTLISDTTVERLLERAIAVQQVAAPTFAESARARAVLDAFSEAGLRDVAMDDIHNVYGRLPGTGVDGALVVSAHLDTVFAADTDLSVTRTAGRIAGPGIADNALALAAIIELPRMLREAHVELARDLWLVANVCEEGEGDLRGMRRVMDRFGTSPAAWIVLEGGFLGHVCFRGVGSQRYRVIVRTEGGHSWLDFGRPSAVHMLADLAHQLAQLPVPSQPKTVLNIGVIEGGTSVNTIAASASLLLDLRSECPDELAGLVARVERVYRSFVAKGVEVTWEVIGRRPAGGLPAGHPLVACAMAALQQAGFDAGRIDTSPSSTDANVPLAAGCPAVCIGLAQGRNLHRVDEYIETGQVGIGLGELLLLVRKLQETQWETT